MVKPEVLSLPVFLTRDTQGFVHLAGHRIGLHHVIRLYDGGYSPEMLQAHYPTLELSLIHKVIAFYLEHEAAVRAYIVAEEAAVADQRNGGEAIPSAASLRLRLAAKKKVEIGATSSEK